MDWFIAVYTNACKQYCDQEFFEALQRATQHGNCQVHIVDNSNGLVYLNRIKSIVQTLNFNCPVEFYHVEVLRDDERTLFLRNVTDSLALLQKVFLKSECKYFLTWETDVIPEADNIMELFERNLNKVDILGGLYYRGFHSADLWGGPDRIEITHHVLSGLSVYRKEVLRKNKFRWSRDNLDAFPDAWMSMDAGKDFILANYTGIKCKHIESDDGYRGHNNIK